MLTNTGPVAKLYLSIIDDVIESVRELFLDEGLEDRVLDDLKHLWESKMMQSKAMEDLRKNSINSSNFVLQLPANYRHPEQEVTDSHTGPTFKVSQRAEDAPSIELFLAAQVVNQANQNIQSLPRLKNSSEALATFSLPAGLSYPVQIPAGVTLQTASGQLYKVNVPVVVTQAAAGQHSASQQKATERREAPASQSAALSASTAHCQEVEPSALSHPNGSIPSCLESGLPERPATPDASHLQGNECPEPQVSPEENDPSSQAEPIDLTGSSPSGDELFDFQVAAEEPSTHNTAQLKSSDIDDILQRVIEEERLKAEMARNMACAKPGSQSDELLGLDLDYSYSDLSDIVQLDGPADNSGEEDVDGGPLDENDFLGLINAEAIKALQEGEGSSDGNSMSSSSDSEVPDDLAIVEEEDPLNSGDDVIEQDIPDLFDTDNVIVCQYDKIHRSKNRWKFHLKDGVMCCGGREYVFSKAVGEAEW